MGLLETMQEKVDLLWQKVIYAEVESERSVFKKEHIEALALFKKQCALVEALGHVEEEKPKPISRDELITPSHEDSKSSSIAKNQKQTQADENSESNFNDSDNTFPPSPFDFADYFSYVLSWLQFQKEHSDATLADFNKNTGLNPESLIEVLKRTKKLGKREHATILSYLKLPELETAFLNVLYLLSTSDANIERSKAMQQLTNFPLFKKNNPIGYEIWKYLSHWYYPVIREMSTLPHFKEDPYWIQSQLIKFVSVPDIKSAVNFLKGANFFHTLPSGKVISHQKHINCVGGIYRLALRNFHKEMLEMTSSAISSVSSENRLLIGHTVALPKKSKEAAFKIITEAIEKIQSMETGDQAEDDIYHFEFAGIPLTQKR